jgi:hypothetical protein
MGLKWFWNRISDEWIVGNPATVLFGVAAALTCLLTVVLVSPLALRDTGIWSQVGWGTLGVLGVLSAFFLWGGMRRFQKMRGQSRFGDTPSVRILMLIGLCWTAVLYYLAVFLPKRREVPVRSIGHAPSNPRRPVFKQVLITAWAIYLTLIAALFLAPKTTVGLLHGAGWLLLLVQILLMFATAVYFVTRFVRGPSRG